MEMEKLVSLCKRRGFIFPSSEIYGGINGFWDFGPLGVELKRNIKDAWWQDNISHHDDTTGPEGAPSPYQMVGLDSSIIMNPKVWVASGHVGGFSDPMVDCRESKERYRADQLFIFSYDLSQLPPREGRPDLLAVAVIGGTVEDAQSALDERLTSLSRKGALPARQKELPEHGPIVSYLEMSPEDRKTVLGPSASEPGTLTEPRQFNLMLETNIGAVVDESSKSYLRPETAQGIFANFKNVVDTSRVKLPFGIAQVGKSFRNEITPRNYIFRSREFEQMEIEFFCRPEESEAWYDFWRKARFDWYVRYGLRSDRLSLRDHDPDELAFYSKATADIEYAFPFGVSELEGIAHRSDYDLQQHMKHSGKDLSYFDEETKERFVPHVVEPSAGADRATLAFLCEAYQEDQMGGESRTVMRFHPRLAPIKAAIFPLVKKDGLPEKAEALYRDLKRQLNVYYDERGAIGRRYRRQDEIGTPYCLTLDGQTNEDDSVTVRDRDSGQQWRVPLDGAARVLQDLIDGNAKPPGSA